MPLLRPIACLVVLALLPAVAAAQDPGRSAGAVLSWSHELNQNEHPRWNPRRTPTIAPARWYRAIGATLRGSGRDGLWFTGPSALPFPPLPLHPDEPIAWRNHRTLLANFRRSGLRWDVAYEVWAARKALASGRAVVADPATRAHTRRLSLLDPAYRSWALREIRRIVPRLRGRPYVNVYLGSDEPITVLPRGAARRSPFGRRLARDFRRVSGRALPHPLARPSGSRRERLRWLAWSRFSGARFVALKRAQARLIRRLDPAAVISPNDFGFIDGFIPWDYTAFAHFADAVDADPYVSFGERARPGRGRYNHGFGAKLMSDLTGARARIVVQAFRYAGYRPRPGDLWTWSAQALRAGATDIAFFGGDNPRYTNRPVYASMRAIARNLRGTRLPSPPVDPSQVVVYATASEGQAQPHRRGGKRYRTTGDALYTLHALLGELNGAAFSFDADTRLERAPARLARARTLWLPRADVLDPGFARRLAAWVHAGGTLIVTDPDAFSFAPSGRRLADLRAELVGVDPGAPRPVTRIALEPSAIAPGVPSAALSLPVGDRRPRSFAGLPPDARVVARFDDGAPAALLRTVGAGRVLAFAADPLAPASLGAPGDLARLAGELHRWAGGVLGHPAWDYRIPGDPDPERSPWPGAVSPEQVGAPPAP